VEQAAMWLMAGVNPQQSFLAPEQRFEKAQDKDRFDQSVLD